MSRIVYGAHPVRELVRARGEVAALFVEPGGARRHADALAAARARGVPVRERARAALDALAGTDRHQGIVAVAGEFRYRALDDVLAAGGGSPLVLVLDGVQDPHNLGSLLRSAAALGASGVVLPRDRAAGVTPAVVKVSAGASERVPVARVTNVARALDAMRDRGLWTVAAVTQGGRPPWELDLRAPCALVVGSEGKGVRPLVERACDLRATIPIGFASLNAAVAGALLLYEAHRQRAAVG